MKKLFALIIPLAVCCTTKAVTHAAEPPGIPVNQTIMAVGSTNSVVLDSYGWYSLSITMAGAARVAFAEAATATSPLYNSATTNIVWNFKNGDTVGSFNQLGATATTTNYYLVNGVHR